MALTVAAGVLDLDDVGTHVAQGLGGIGAEDEFGQIDDADAGERAPIVWHDCFPK